MRKVVFLVLVLFAALALWFSIIFWVPSLSTRVLLISGKCPTADIAAQSCREVLSALGATGDIFGAVTSLFSGLALFAVAITLWVDSNAKRIARKPLVVTYLDNDSVVLDAPSVKESKKLRLTVTAKVANQTGEPALNVRVLSAILASGDRRDAPLVHLRLPLLSGGTEEVTYKAELTGTHLEALLAALTRDNTHVSLEVTTKYHSLEGVAWQTSATYELRCKLGERRRRLNAFRSGTDDFTQLWENDAAVPLDVDVRADSWSHRMA